jgi:hypothetical protein
MHHNVFTFFSVHNCLDEDFDAPDVAADRQLCQAIGAGKMGLHPDAWGNHDPLPLRWLMRRRPERELPGFGQPLPIEHRQDVWNEPKPKPKPKPKPQKPPRPAWHPHTSSNDAPRYGTLQLTCDVCDRAWWGGMLDYRGDRMVKVAEIRALGHKEGWTCIAGVDRCPKCSQAITVPDPVGNGAGGDQGNEQHA